MLRIRVGFRRILPSLGALLAKLQGVLKPFAHDLLPQRIPLLADSDGVLAEFCAEGLFYQEYALELMRCSS